MLKGNTLPRINAMVDVVNWCSVEFQLPYGLYDASRIDGSVTMRLGREGEEYAGIRKDVVHVAGRIAVADDQGPFGNPTSDSARTMVTTETTDALVVVVRARRSRSLAARACVTGDRGPDRARLRRARIGAAGAVARAHGRPPPPRHQSRT